MREIILGKAYDTDTAKVIASIPISSNLGLSEEYNPTLYNCPNGPFLVDPYHSGGIHRILPLSKHEAMEWIDENVPRESVESAYKALGVEIQEG